jgi:hypothetical protein
MYTTLRQYGGITAADFITLMSRTADVEILIRKVPGFVQYQLVRTTAGITSITVCKDRVGAETSNLTVAAWIELNLPALLAKSLVITGGEQVVHFSA